MSIYPQPKIPYEPFNPLHFPDKNTDDTPKIYNAEIFYNSITPNTSLTLTMTNSNTYYNVLVPYSSLAIKGSLWLSVNNSNIFGINYIGYNSKYLAQHTINFSLSVNHANQLIRFCVFKNPSTLSTDKIIVSSIKQLTLQSTNDSLEISITFCDIPSTNDLYLLGAIMPNHAGVVLTINYINWQVQVYN